MSDKGKILIGIVIFLVLVLFPIWYAAASGSTDGMPALDPGTDATECVRDKAWMRANHMDLLDEWRDEVVRGTGDAFFEMGGKRTEKSLTRTCLGCHTDRDAFCTRCHDYVSVDPYCWDCHNVPGGE